MMIAGKQVKNSVPTIETVADLKHKIWFSALNIDGNEVYGQTIDNRQMKPGLVSSDDSVSLHKSSFIYETILKDFKIT